MPIVGKYLNDNKTCLKVRFEQNNIYNKGIPNRKVCLFRKQSIF